MTFRNLIAAFLLLASTMSVSAQFWTETFSTQAAFNAWTSANVGQGTQVWNRSIIPGYPMGFTTAPASFSAPTANNGFAFYDSDLNGNGFTHNATLTYGPINCSAHASVGLRFHSQFADFQGSTAQVRISTNGGTSWTAYDVFDDQPSYGIGQGALVPSDVLTEMPIPAANGQGQVWVQFRWEGFWEYGWKLDDIEMYDYVAPPHNVTFKVNTALINVNPAGMWIIGTVTNLTPAVMTNDGGGIWSYTVPLTAGDYKYRFINGPNPANAENGLTLAACGVANPTFGGYDRTITVGTEDIVLPVVCYNSCSGCVLPCNLNPNAIICDDFETYNVGNISPQSNHWIPWNLVDAPTNALSAEVSTDFASNGTKSMKVKLDGAGDDQLLQLGDKSTGRYSLSWKYYIPTGKATYFNVQITEIVPQPAPPSANFATEVYFRATGKVDQVSPTPAASDSFPFNQWFPVKIIVDLDNNLAKLFVNGNLLRAWAYTGNFGAIDFYAADATYLAYIDEVEYIKLPSISYNVDVCDAAVDLTLFFGQALAQTTGIYNNTTATVSPTDPTVDCWNELDPGQDILNTTMWYTFVGDGQKYQIQTVPCNATNYIGGVNDPGDTQMLIYAGDDCTDLTEVACNDDLDFAQFGDWRSGVDLQTDPGQNYYMLIDGFDNLGTVAKGEFCIEIKKIASVLCADGAVGTYTASSDVLCWDAAVGSLITVDPSGFVLPNEGLVYGMCWAVSNAPLDPTIYPADQTGNYLGSAPVLTSIYLPGDINNGAGFLVAGNIYYYTPVVIGNGVNNSGQPNFLHNIEITNGCYYVGESVAITVMPLTDDITATAVAGLGSVNLTPNGGISGVIGDDFYFSYQWSNGATTQDLSGVPPGTYTCTVSDPCSGSGTASATVILSGTQDPASIQSFVVSPNPTTGILTLNLALATAAEVRIEVLNTLGQTLQTLNAGKLSNLSQTVNMSSMAQGSYFLRVTVDGETAIRRVVVQR